MKPSLRMKLRTQIMTRWDDDDVGGDPKNANKLLLPVTQAKDGAASDIWPHVIGVPPVETTKLDNTFHFS